MVGVDQHSTYRRDPWARLISTSEYIWATTFGDTATADAAARRVREIHKHVRGTDPYTGRPYRADDPELLLWIHCAEVHSFMTGYHYFGHRLEQEEKDRYVQEMVKAAELVGLHAEDVPHDHGELTDYLRGENMDASPAAKEALRFVLFPPVVWPGGKYPDIPAGRLLEIPGRVGWAVPSAAAVAVLPESARRIYRLPRLRAALPALRIYFAGFVRAMNEIAPPPAEIADIRARMEAAA
jgi:uncharacterized protein (DUF2236 family)